ncbi:hypothetical protein ACERK3_18440 [Phycisphaerales bacterium AB-hyl4]|uniref:Uncharacterized protein n=1 Tax=Natronomicrosphaera hydrolytica TaxID=3242702 RepID=A0ABV4U9I5_9BACT
MFETLRIGLVVAAIGVAGWMAIPAGAAVQMVDVDEPALTVEQAQPESYAGGDRQRRRDGQGPNAENRQPCRDGHGPHGERRRERGNEDCMYDR